MEPDRNSYGRFDNGLGGLGATAHVQKTYGVQHWDNEQTAANKVIQGRGEELQQAIASGAYNGPLFSIQVTNG